MATQTRSGERQLNSPVAFASGTAFVLLGLAGLLLPVSGPAIGPDGFQATMLHNALHVAAGAALVAAGILGARQATLANTAVGVASLALVVIGPSATGSGATPAALNLLHVVLGLALTAAGLCGDRKPL
ncbi:MAG TPA: hypothetical protein VF657_04230 [Actinoplanes sp.]|jgi:hypothetical protein